MHKGIAAKNKQLRADNKLWPRRMTEVPRNQWPGEEHAPSIVVRALYRSCDYLAQLIDEKGRMRLSVMRTRLNAHGEFEDGITWDELQRIKGECGFGAAIAVEVFPPDANLVNVSNMRHLWFVDALPFLWRPEEKPLFELNLNGATLTAGNLFVVLTKAAMERLSCGTALFNTARIAVVTLGNELPTPIDLPAVECDRAIPDGQIHVFDTDGEKTAVLFNVGVGR